jgi:hypothetical protein
MAEIMKTEIENIRFSDKDKMRNKTIAFSFPARITWNTDLHLRDCTIYFHFKNF